MSPDMPEDAETYLVQLQRHLAPMPAEERGRIVQEIRSHLAERAAVGPQMLNASITQLGPPRLLARTFVDDWRLSGALKHGPSWRILLAILRRAGTSFAAVLIGTIGVVLYVMAVAFVVVAVMKPISPANVGAWADRHGNLADFGVIFGPPHATPELLGWWIIPVSLAGALLCYFAAHLIMRAGGRLLLKWR